MEVGDKLKELNMTEEEVDRLTKAFKDENFRKMLHDYAEEISDPENKKKYEEEIKMLEQERGNTIEFVHPTPFKALRTSVDGKQKCYVNICTNDKVGKPTSSCGVSEEGCRGQYWSLPHNLHPGRQFTDHKGNKFVVYDVVFHPDTLHIARKNRRFMEMVDSTAVQAIQKSFNVTLDGNNLKEMKTKYKGTPQPCVIRKPIPGYKPQEPSDKCDPLAFPYPDEKKPQHNGTVHQPVQIQPSKSTGLTQPKYTVKYRSYIDLQDFRYSRDSAQSPRPKEIVVTIDLPLLKSATEVKLEVEEKRLLLESEKPAYRLELPLAYSVDEEKGEAKFNKQKGQLTVTLPVRPSKETCPFAAGPPQTAVGDEEEEVEIPLSEAGSSLEEKEGENLTSEAQNDREPERKEEKEELHQEEEEGEKSRGTERQQGMEDDPKQIQDNRVEEKETEREKEEWMKEEDSLATDSAEEIESGTTGFQCDTSDRHPDASAEEISIDREEFEAEHEGHLGNREEDLDPCLTTMAATQTAIKGEEQEEEVKVIQTPVENEEVRFDQFQKRRLEMTHFCFQVGTVAPLLQPSSSQGEDSAECCSTSAQTHELSMTPGADESTEPSGGTSGEEVALCSEEGDTSSEVRENMDEDDLPTEQTFHSVDYCSRAPPAVLREIDQDGNEIIISDHRTSAGFTFSNTLMFELD